MLDVYLYWHLPHHHPFYILRHRHHQTCTIWVVYHLPLCYNTKNIQLHRVVPHCSEYTQYPPFITENKTSEPFKKHYTRLTVDPRTPKSIGFLCYPGWMCGPSLRKVCLGVLELLIGNEKVTDGRTCAKQYALFSMPSKVKW